ncbi:hypothetical protein ACOMICROBIO_LMKGKHOH_04027 [Vibrio sp. B1FIG11]|uniref:hypothetical protein n=1 Tax=Vibrio TaxID=662 RepID=UPI00097FB56C|nr:MULTISPECIES: hypothetical protein [Vibrio]AQM69929.1 hypothetical protein Vca1114GL_03503 [Vibrio campbellii]CAD7827225.1 hypothetical protein ACOMICROBIO_LMKGKHOH_04027 [Vibrio sp. B1FIG11]CAE6963196.1 hypothetical protein ACOMICROBIO_LMKGKHOH_04027 [Vibrio sp. B1FIG11]
MSDKPIESRSTSKHSEELGRYTPRPTELVDNHQFDFERWQFQLNQNFSQLAHQLEKMHAELAQALDDNMAQFNSANHSQSSKD